MDRNPAPPIREIRSALLEIASASNRAKELMRRNRELFQHRTVEKLPLDVNSVVRDVAGQIQIRLCLDTEGMVRIAVQDTGIGLGGVDIDRMFTPWYTTKPSGTGVGLSISRSIVEAHGGILRAEPNDGAGASFVFTLPAAAGCTLETNLADGGRSGRVA